ncbi:secondary thiamine-phosphate synthase enzyme YjbQ [Aquisalimonas sp.]|uniref:secondary thiamine-phosphate synthase enzyme YjbQ n=1 Tax=Aquisalimonas sp. TaxID=1872621 RepID=UPI0025BC696E|nr:secondary thiamine-phosphate synthase enzyme YjbQ [Aquisalimonas sp.]
MQQHSLVVKTTGRGLFEITGELTRVLTQSDYRTGLCHVFSHHTSASLVIQENADPSVQRDLERLFARLVPDGDSLFEHTVEGPDDMPAHVRSALTQTDVTIPVREGRLGLGTWQGVYLWEHRHRAHRRQITVTLHGDSARP